jgi:hypothetical protein
VTLSRPGRTGGVLLLGLLLVACDARDGASTDAPAQVALQNASFGTSMRVPHEGVRLVEFFQPDGTRLAYREHVVTDDGGRYAIDFVELVEGESQDSELFGMLQDSSQGFLHRYRDFSIRNGERFDRNYTWHDRDELRVVAGRTCRLIEVKGTGGRRGSYVLALDQQTGALLASEERDPEGRLVHAVTYESFDPDPDLSKVHWHEPVNREKALDMRVSLEQQLGEHVLEPRLLPAGYAWSEAATLSDGQRPWLKCTYTDGVQTALFMQGLEAVEPDRTEATPEPISPAGSPADRVTVYSMGTVTVVQGHVAGRDVIALGRVPEADLLSLIESALPEPGS